MENIMELDELKTAWQTLDRRLQQHNAINLQLFKDTKLEKARSSLRPLFWGQMLQLLLGIGLIVLGIACWTRNTDVAGLFVAGMLVHTFGVITIAAAGITLGLMGNIDYSAPVLKIQKQMAMLLRFYTVNSDVCGLPWWIMWVLVVVAFAGLGQVDPQATTPAWIWISLVIGVAGLLGTWCFHLWKQRTPAQHARVADGGDGIRRSQRILDEITQFEKE
ncbi:MAG TPA: serine/threonine protein kinase [Pseudoxanthomonas sp.]|nr:serine/threonine protein kinase [Pseudoxanthomonas sp.]